MVAFAANSLLNRLALADGEIGPGGFAAVRVATGVLVLAVLLTFRERSIPPLTRPNATAVAGLTAYMLGFSFAYVSLDAGLGALVLFGGVQITMFVGALLGGEPAPIRRWVGMVFAMAGLAVLTFPSGPVTLPVGALMLMSLAAIGWGVYSLVGRGVSDPLLATGWNFFYSLPIVIFALFLWPDAGGERAWDHPWHDLWRYHVGARVCAMVFATPATWRNERGLRTVIRPGDCPGAWCASAWRNRNVDSGLGCGDDPWWHCRWPRTLVSGGQAILSASHQQVTP